MHYTIERLSNIRLIWQHWRYLNNNRWCCCHSYYRQGKQSVGAGGMNIAAMACLYFKQQQQQNLCLATPLASHAVGNAATAAKVLSPQPRTVHSPLSSSLLLLSFRLVQFQCFLHKCASFACLGASSNDRHALSRSAFSLCARGAFTKCICACLAACVCVSVCLCALTVCCVTA